MAKKATTKKPGTAAANVSWQHVNRIQLGLLLGVHPDTVTDYIRQGMPVVTAGGRGKESVYDAIACLDWWRQRQGKNAKEAAQTRSYDASAKLNELKLQRERGELYSRDELILDGQAYTKGWTSKVRALPRQLRQAGVLTTAEQEAHAAAICRQILADIAGWKTRADTTRTDRKTAA